MTEEPILITLMHENTTYLFIFPFFEIFRGLLAPYGAAPGFKFVFEPVHMIHCMDSDWQPIPKMRPSDRKGTIARLFFGTRDLKCNGQIRTETVFSFVENMKTNNQEN